LPKREGRKSHAMLHHVSIGSNDIARSRALYDPVMAILG
jgi:hypothetical protein